MKTTWKIAKAELQYLFYSPVAWLIFVIFAVQSGLVYCQIWDSFVKSKLLGYSQSFVTYTNFAGWGRGFFIIIQNYLYLYIPLLTMGIMSRELSSGSINLLYSSPVSNSQIIRGKYLALVIYALSLIGILSVYSIFSMVAIDNVDIPLILSGILGIFLLICAYSAIGLFVSSLTSYQVVAAVVTIAILAVMNYIKGIGQEFEIIRDITYWLALSGRSDHFIAGLLCSEDIIYFLAIIVLFLSFAIIKLTARRKKKKWYITSSKFVGVFLAVVLIGYISSRPQFMSYYDTTRTKQNTLTENSQHVISKLKGGLTITTYNNLLEGSYWYGLPQSIKEDMNRFQQYVRFKPDIKLKYVNYYYKTGNNPYLDMRYPGLTAKECIDTLRKLNNWNFEILSPEEVSKTVNLEPEGYRFTRLIERDSGEKTFLRIFNDTYKFPFETEITAAMKRLVMEELPTVGFVSGHGERSYHDAADWGYKIFSQEKTFRHSLINQGFGFMHISLQEEVPQEVNMLVIAEPKEMLSETEMKNLDSYIARGANLMILGEPGAQKFMNPIVEKFGVTMSDGVVAKVGRILEPKIEVAYSSGGERVDTIPAVTIAPELMVVRPINPEWSYHLKKMAWDENNWLVSPTFCALKHDAGSKFDFVPLFACKGSWSEVETTDLLNDEVHLNPEVGEKIEDLTLVAALSRQINGKEQRIMIAGDSDWLSNKELNMARSRIKAANYHLINATFFWLSHEEVPIDIRRPNPPDRTITIGKTAWAVAKPLIKWVYPAILLIFGLLIWIRRRGR